jgi:hypothetical protein
LNDYEFILNIELPFSWIAFYVAALLFSIGSAIYYWRCPKIIRENNSFGDFLKNGRNRESLKTYYSEISQDENEVDNILNDEIYDKDISNVPNSLTSDLAFQKREEEKRSYFQSYDSQSPASVQSEIRSTDIIRERLLQEKIADSRNRKLNADFWIVYNECNYSRLKYRIISAILYFLGFLLVFFIILQGAFFVYQSYN